MNINVLPSCLQTKLHDEICAKRTTATIATHDLGLLKAPLMYDARSPDTLKVSKAFYHSVYLFFAGHVMVYTSYSYSHLE